MTREVEADAKRDAQFRIMRVLEVHPDYSQREIARVLGVSLGAVNYCLNSLIEIGFVKVRNFRASGHKVRYVYLLTPKGAAVKAAHAHVFLQRKLQEYEALKAEIASLRKEAGE